MDLDYLSAVVDEVALEGLDGITINTLWKRLECRPGFGIKLDPKSKPFLWKRLTTVKDLDYYVLPKARPQVDIWNRMDFVDPESGHMVELNKNTKDDHHVEVYPVKCVNRDGVIGSCATYETRRLITSEIVCDGKPLMLLDEVVERFGEKLVIVASQKKRNEALLGKSFDPTYTWIDVTYCILERVGRGRYGGELSAGPLSLDVFKMPSKTLFYHTLKLVKLGVLKKQDISILTKSNKHQLRKIFHLTRFFKVVNSKNFIIAMQIATYLLAKPNHREIIHKTRNDMHIEEKSFNKVYKNYKKIFKTYLIPYREMFPHAKEKEYMTKSKISEKYLRVIECTRMPSSARDEESDEEDTEADEDTENEQSKNELKPFSYVYERPLLYQGLMAVESAGPKGVNRAELTKMMHIDYYDGRSMCKNLVKSGCVVDVVLDLGKTKKIQYIAKKFKQQSDILKEYYTEQDKFLELIKTEQPDDGFDDTRTDVEVTESSQDDSIRKSTDIEFVCKVEPEIKVEGEVEVPGEMMDGIKDMSVVRDLSVLQRSVDQSLGRVTDYSQDNSELEESLSELSYSAVKRKQSKKEAILTGKHFKRLSWILEAVRDAKLIENAFHLMKNLRAKEKADGNVFIMDKKTLMKLLDILVKQGKVRCIKTIIGTGENTKQLQFYCDPSILPNDNIVKSAIEQAKLKSFSVSRETLKHSSKVKAQAAKKPCKAILQKLPDSARESICKLHEFKSKLKSTDMVYEKKAAKMYGYKPKMQRARIVHQLLWYLVYGYQGKLAEQEEEMEVDNEEEAVASTSSEEKSKTPPVYFEEMSWKRYLAPLPEHRGYPKGWCLISDVLLSLPLCVFCSLVHVSYKIDGLMEWLSDPVKCLYPISFLPCKITQQLLFARKYIFAFHENCMRICHMGLLSFGSSNNKEKDQVFIYLRKYASLVDTRQSLQGYYKTRMPDNHELEMKTYHFDSSDALDQYWVDLKHFAFSSNLGHKLLTENDREDETVGESGYLSLESAQSPKTPQSIIDDGIIPGDGRGPAGLDSYLYCHLHRNWSWGNLQPKPKTSAFTDSLHGVEESKKIESEKAIAMFEERKQMAISSSPPPSTKKPKERITLIGGKKGQTAEVVQVKVAKTKGNKGGKGIKRKKSVESLQSLKKIKSKVQTSKKLEKKKKKGNKWQDDKDKAALETKTGMRVHWSSKEDGLLLTSKIASLVMDKNSRGMIIPWIVVRDVLYEYAPEESVDKSSLACQRRVAHSLKNPIVKQNLSIFYAEAIQDPKVKAYMNKKYTQGSDETIRMYKEVVDILIKKFASVDVKECPLPEAVEDLKKFTISVVNPSVKSVVFYDPTNKSDILESVLHNIFHSFVSINDKQGRAHEMYQLLSQYPDKLLEKVLNKMRANSLIVKIKKNAEAKIIETGIQGVKLSQKYSYRFQSRFPVSIFEESVECLKQLIDFYNVTGDSGKQEITTLSKGGYCAGYIGLFSSRKLTFQIRIPKDIVILDPSLKNKFNRGIMPTLKDDAIGNDDDSDSDQLDSESDITSDSTIGQSKPSTSQGDSVKPKTRGNQITRCYLGNRSIIEYQEIEEDQKKEQVKDIASQASRALITMRRSRAKGATDLKVYNVQDYFVINRCTLKIGLDTSDKNLSQECKLDHISLEEANKEQEVPVKTPSSMDLKRQKLMKKLKQKKPEEESSIPELTVPPSKIAQIVKRLTRTLPFELDEETEWESFNPLKRQNLKQVHSCIDKCGESGITVYELKKKFHYSELLQPCIKCLEERNLIVKVGVTSVRYVTLKNVRPWAVHSYKNTRGRGTGVQHTGGTDKIDVSQPSASNSSAVSGVKSIGSSKTVLPHTRDKTDEKSSTSTAGESSKKEDNSKTQGDDSSESVQHQSSYPKPASTYEKIRLILMPWKKPEGLLNKPVFKMMIESLMLYVMSFSGANFNNICEKYSPYLQPFCIRELLDVLEELDCIKKVVFRKPKKVSLFSRPAELQDSVEEQYEDDNIFYEATPDCVVKLGQFMEKI